ncbi:ATP-binding protein [Bradyrhizobium sp. SEMIA]|uniref:ATP-binding protein n=1 Tax=Bradyrhizobium sp. SEMIA TaxID=2597515 RepID=UPI0018A6557B|nr:ATP-binding protein [Bradyrhizobium sp. SEMIA]QOG19826.1 hypothetical protein FOM02_23235 [Bradyrhizobium sp. SEMIA]
MSDDDNSPISAREAKQLFAGLKSAPALVLAVSGGPDSVALMWLAARWRRSFSRAPRLLVVTVDHGLRPEAARGCERLARANAAVEVLADGAERFLRLRDRGDASQAAGRSFEASAFALLPEEVRLRLLLRAIDALGHEGPAELGKVETLLAALDRAIAADRPASRRAPANGRAILKQTLAGALISLAGGRIHIAPAPARRSKGR